MYRSTGLDDMHPRVSNERANVVATSLSIIFEKSCLPGEVPGDWKKKKETAFSFLKIGEIQSHALPLSLS